MSLILEADAFYRAAEHPAVCRSPVLDQAGRRFSVALAKLLGDLQEDASEPDWEPIIAMARQVRFRVATEPVPLDSAFSGVAGPLEDLLIGADQLSGNLDYQRQSILEELIGAACQIQHAANQPFGDAILECLLHANPSSTCLIAERRRTASAIEGWLVERGHQVAVFTPRTFMEQARIWGLGVAIGAGSWFPSQMLSAPRAEAITLVHPDWIRDMHQVQGVFGDLASCGITITIRERRQGNFDGVSAEQTQQVSALDVVPTPDWVALAASTLQPDVQEQNAVESRPVVLGGGYVVWLPLAGQHIRGLNLAGLTGRRVVNLPISALTPDSVLLLRHGDTETTALRPVVDSLLGPLRDHVRQLQADWKSRLQEALKEPGAAQLARQMKDRGARTVNLQYWASDDCLRPLRDGDFRILLETLGVASPGRHLEAGRQLWRAHNKAGHRLTEALEDHMGSQELSELDMQGVQELRLRDVPGVAAMVAFRVISIGRETMAISPHLVRRPIPTRGAAWLE